MSAAVVRHPARYSDAILRTIAPYVADYPVILDPFAGTGRVHELRRVAGVEHTIGVELEAEWAAMHPDTIHGDALQLPELVGVGTVDAIVTSPAYGNRMADHHEARDGSRRNTYRHALGRQLTDGNAGAMQWGTEYREFHWIVWALAVLALRDGGRFVLNVKNHIRAGVEQPVAEWHRDVLERIGMVLVASERIPTRGLAMGRNAELRTPCEMVYVFDKPSAVDE